MKGVFLLLTLLLLLFAPVSSDVSYAREENLQHPNVPAQQSGPSSQPNQPSGPSSEPARGDVSGDAANADVTLFDPLNRSIEEIFLSILDIIIVFAVPIVLFFIVWAGFLYVTARGDTTQLEKAHKALLYAVIGGLIVVGAQALLAVITNTISLFG